MARIRFSQWYHFPFRTISSSKLLRARLERKLEAAKLDTFYYFFEAPHLYSMSKSRDYWIRHKFFRRDQFNERKRKTCWKRPRKMRNRNPKTNGKDRSCILINSFSRDLFCKRGEKEDCDDHEGLTTAGTIFQELILSRIELMVKLNSWQQIELG